MIRSMTPLLVAVERVAAHDFQVVKVVTRNGQQVNATASIEDGGQELVLRLSDFRAGDRLEFSVDVDEVLRNAADLGCVQRQA